jgi:hypothetical protein
MLDERGSGPLGIGMKKRELRIKDSSKKIFSSDEISIIKHIERQAHDRGLGKFSL